MMKIPLVFVIFLISFTKICFCQFLGSEINLCAAEDVECIAKITTMILNTHPNGWPEFDLPNLEPLKINSIKIVQPDGSVALNLTFKNVDVFGLSKLTVERAVGFKADPKSSKFELYAHIPKLQLIGNYQVKGKILILPIEGDGKCNIELEPVKASVKFKPLLQERNGKTYFAVDKLKLRLDPNSFKIRLENLFNGDKTLGAQMNTFINENWRDIWKELGPSISEAFGEVVKVIATNILKHAPYEDIFRKP